MLLLLQRQTKPAPFRNGQQMVGAGLLLRAAVVILLLHSRPVVLESGVLRIATSPG